MGAPANKRRKNRRKKIIEDAAREKGRPHCTYCGVPVSPNAFGAAPDAEVQFLTLDHIIPKAFGGCDDRRNQCIACAPCNHGRATMRLDRFIKSLGDRAAISVEQAKALMAEAQKVCNAINGGTYDSGWMNGGGNGGPVFER